MPNDNFLNLSDEELLLLDGKVSEDTQQLIDKIKHRLALESKLEEIPEKYRKWAAELIALAESEGRLVREHTKLSRCPCCNQQKTYATYKRNSRYHNKGDFNYSKPLYVHGWEFQHRFISFVGYPGQGICYTCWDEVSPYLVNALSEVKAEIPYRITGQNSRWFFGKHAECKKCGWIGPEYEMGQLPAVFGGYYRGQCPNCGEKSLPFGPFVFSYPGGFSLLELTSENITKYKLSRNNFQWLIKPKE